MEALKRQVKYQVYDSKKPFIIFWIIILLVNIGFYALNLYFDASFGMQSNEAAFSMGLYINDTKVNVAAGNIISIAIFFIVYNMMMYYESFPIAIGFSSSRKDFYIGAVIHNFILALSMSVIQGILMKLDGKIITLIGKQPLYDQLIFNLKDDNILYIILMLTIMFMVLSSFFNLLGAAIYKFRNKIWIAVFVLPITILNLKVVTSIFKTLGDFFFSKNNLIIYAVKQLSLALILYALAWIIVRRLSVRNSK